MLLLKRILPIAAGAITLAGFLWIGLAQTGIWLVMAAVMLWATLCLGWLTGWGADLERWGLMAVAPIIFLASAFAFMLFLETPWVLAAIAAGVGVFIALYFEHVFRFVYAPALYQPYVLEYTSMVLYIASMYFLATTSYGLNTFLQMPIWILALTFFLVASLVVYETLWVSKIPGKHAAHIGFVGGLVLMELFVALSFLPTSFYVNAAVVAVAYYVLMGVVRAQLLQKLSRSVLRRYVVAGAAMALVVLLSAKWV